MLKDGSKNQILLLLALFLELVGIQAIGHEQSDEKRFPEVIAFNQLTRDLNRLSTFKKISIQIPEIGQKIILVSQPQYLNSSSKKDSLKSLLPPISTDSSQINPIDLAAFGFSNSDKASADPAKSLGVLPIPQARTVSPVGEQSSSKPLEAPLKNQEAFNNFDVIAGLTPQTTRFGKDRYDKNLFIDLKDLKKDPSNLLKNGNSDLSQGTGAGTFSPFNDPSTDENDPQKDESNKNPEKEARESFQKTMDSKKKGYSGVKVL